MGLFRSLENAKKEEQAQIVPVKFTNIDLTVDQFNSRIAGSENLNRDDMVAMIKNSYRIILDEIFLHGSENREGIQNLFKNINFVNAFIEVANMVEFSNSQKICLNKLTWDYMTSDENDNAIKESLMTLSGIVNRDIVQRLSVIVPIKAAKFLAMARKSSFKEEKNMYRANFILCKSMTGLSEQTIIDVYGVLFKVNITLLFQTIMFDDLREHCVTEEESENCSMIANAIITILENMSTADIISILSSYVSAYNLMKKNRIRFGIRTIAQSDYPRIYKVVDLLENEGIIVP